MFGKKTLGSKKFGVKGIGISIGIGSICICSIGIGINISIGKDSFLQSLYCLKLTGTDRQAGRQGEGQTCVLGGCASKNGKNKTFLRFYLDNL